jgi:outer membrane protein assembly factor BamD (BamD/ComL family)
MGEDALRLIADYRFAVGDMDLAQDEYARLVREYPNGRHSAHAMLRAAEAADAAFAGVEFDARPLLEAAERYRQFLTAYPAYAQEEAVPRRLEAIEQKRAEKDYHVAQWYERTKHPEAAAFYYHMIVRDWPDSLQATLSRQRLEALGQPPSEADEPSGDAPLSEALEPTVNTAVEPGT